MGVIQAPFVRRDYQSCQQPWHRLCASVCVINAALFAVVGVAPTTSTVSGYAQALGDMNIIPHRNFPSSSRSSYHSTRNLQQEEDDYLQAPDGSCHLDVSTRAMTDIVIGRGIVFAIESDNATKDDVEITSIGFHVDPAVLSDSNSLIGYEVFALNEGVEGGGYFANFNSSDPFDIGGDPDYRGKTEYWQSIAKGTISQQNLTESDASFFRIPFATFNTTTVPDAGGARSFYISTDTSAFITSFADSNEVVNDEVDLNDDNGVNAPKILVGQSVSEWVTEPFSYTAKAFVGRVYYETECNSQAPSTSAQPSGQPSLPLQKRPSEQPSLHPSSVPSLHPSLIPSFSPTVPIEKIDTGLLVQFLMACEPDEDFPDDQETILANLVAETILNETQKLNPPINNMIAEVERTVCRPIGQEPRRLIAGPDQRYLQVTGSSALDFSLVITGEYRTPCRPGQVCENKPDYDLGSISEDSINRDKRGFVKNLKDRTRQFTPNRFAEVEADDLSSEAFDLEEDDEGNKLLPVVTRSPTPAPPDSDTDVLLIAIIITAGLIILLLAFILYRHSERRAIKARRKEIAQREREREMRRWEMEQRAAWEQAYKQSLAGRNAPPLPPPPPPHLYGPQQTPHV